MATIRQGQQTLSKECNDIIYLHRLHKKIMEKQEKRKTLEENGKTPKIKKYDRISIRPGQKTLSKDCTDAVYMHRLLKDVREKGKKAKAERQAWVDEYNRKHGIIEE